MDINRKSLIAYVGLSLLILVVSVQFIELNSGVGYDNKEYNMYNVNQVYPFLTRNEAVDSQLSHVERYKGLCLITDQHGRKFSVNAYTLKKSYFDDDTCMIYIAKENDRIVKNADSDTLFLHKPNGKTHIFKIIVFQE